jgi:alpha-tubulin suppressor-like RCC1 family protein
VPVSGGIVFASLSVSEHITCGLTGDGVAYCWGDNAFGQLGLGNTVLAESTIPLPVATEIKFESISAGHYHVCGIATNGAAYCWGSNHMGQLGDGTQSASATPVPVSGGFVFVAITVGVYSTCGIATNSNTYCWGDTGSAVAVTSPVIKQMGIVLTSISMDGHGCGLILNGSAYCWGSNTWGQLGNGLESYYIDSPVSVLGDILFVSVNVGNSHTCGIAIDGRGYCWGWNFSGQLGIGTSAYIADYSRNMPVPILPPE